MSKTILLADDSVTIQKVIELTFMDQDCEVIAVSTGDEAIQRLDQMEPDLVIADVHMPGADGYEVARQSKERHPGVPVLLLVGTFEPFDEGEMASSGADSHLKKPFDSQELLQLVERLMESAEAAGGAAGPEAEAAEPEAPAPAGPTPVPAAPPSPPQPPVSGAETVRLDSLKEADLAAATAPPAEPAAEEESLSLEEIEEAPAVQSTEVQAPADATPLSEREPEGTPFRLSELDSEGFSLEPDEEDEPEVAADQPEPVEAQPVEVTAEPVAEEAPVAATGLSDEDVERIARRVAELVGERAVKEVAWEIIPDLAEVMIKDRIQQLESQVE